MGSGNAAVANMADLRVLHLGTNYIRDISPLGSLQRLGEVEPLEGLVRPQLGGSRGWRDDAMLQLNDNQITDISALGDNPAIRGGGWQRLKLWRNPLNDEAYSVHIPALQERGVAVLFDPKP